MTARTFPARRSLGGGGCSMKITEGVRKYAEQQGLTDLAAIEARLREKTEEFAKRGAELYSKT